VDTVNLCEKPLMLAAGPVMSASPLHAVAVIPEGKLWKLCYRTAANRDEQYCVLLPHDPTESFIAGLYASTQNSAMFQHFQRCNYSRRNTGCGVTVVIG